MLLEDIQHVCQMTLWVCTHDKGEVCEEECCTNEKSSKHTKLTREIDTCT